MSWSDGLVRHTRIRNKISHLSTFASIAFSRAISMSRPSLPPVYHWTGSARINDRAMKYRREPPRTAAARSLKSPRSTSRFRLRRGDTGTTARGLYEKMLELYTDGHRGRFSLLLAFGARGKPVIIRYRKGRNLSTAANGSGYPVLRVVQGQGYSGAGEC